RHRPASTSCALSCLTHRIVNGRFERPNQLLFRVGMTEGPLMRILIVSQYFHPENFRINELALQMKQQGHEVVILTAQPNYPGGRFFPGHGLFSPWRDSFRGLEVIRVPVFPRGQGRSWELVLNYFSFVLFATVLGLPR